MERHEVIEISSDTDEELSATRPHQVPMKQQQSKFTEALSRGGRGFGPSTTGAVSFADKNMNDIQTKEMHTSKRKALPAPSGSSVTSTPKPSRKQGMSSQQTELDKYAQKLFNDLNDLVFNNRIPDTELVWNVRFCTTAGRAFYHRDKKSNITTKIELSPKVVDCKDRVRCVLAHEMCHLAVWVLDDDPAEKGHSTKFKRWARLVEGARSDIIVNTTHSYEIRYKYKWECVQCGKIYGRHSNSINVEKNACGACTPPGTLRPLFGNHGPCKVAYKRQDSPSTRQPFVSLEGKKFSSDDEIEMLLPRLNNISV